MNIGQQIKKARESKNITQSELSSKTGITVTSLSRYENGDRNPKFENVEKIALALGMTVEELTNNENDSDDIFNVKKSLKDQILQIPVEFRYPALIMMMSALRELYPEIQKEHERVMKIQLDRFLKIFGGHKENDN